MQYGMVTYKPHLPLYSWLEVHYTVDLVIYLGVGQPWPWPLYQQPCRTCCCPFLRPSLYCFFPDYHLSLCMQCKVSYLSMSRRKERHQKKLHRQCSGNFTQTLGLQFLAELHLFFWGKGQTVI